MVEIFSEMNEIEVISLLSRVDCSILGQQFIILVKRDLKDPVNGRLFIQLMYSAPCTKTGDENILWKGRKWYLSEHMTSDEIIKTCYAAFEGAVKHEIMEGFKVDGKILFNPHVNFEELLKITDKEISRD